MTVGDPRPSRRIADALAGTAKIRDEGRCRACGRIGYFNRHHLVSRAQRGDDLDENIVPLCGTGITGCHGAIHEHPSRVSEPSRFSGLPWQAVATALRANLLVEELAYIESKKGLAWLNDHYPV